jgi:hypothetical protein
MKKIIIPGAGWVYHIAFKKEFLLAEAQQKAVVIVVRF